MNSRIGPRLIAVASIPLALALAACSSSGSTVQDAPTAPAAATQAAIRAAVPPARSHATVRSHTTVRTTPVKRTPAKPVATLARLTTGRTTFTLKPSFMAELATLKLAPALVDDAMLGPHGGETGLVLPITGGHLTIYRPSATPRPVRGVVRHAPSGFSLRHGSTEVKFTHLVIDYSRSMITATAAVKGRTIASGFDLFDLDQSTMRAPRTNSGRPTTLSGITVYLAARGAAVIDSVFDIAALSGARTATVATLATTTG